MLIQFAASQSIDLPVSELGRPLEHYLRQPLRLVGALTEPDRVQILGGDRFRIRLRPLQFLSLTVSPTADLQLWVQGDGVQLQSVACSLEGAPLLNDRFDLDLQGVLQPIRHSGGTVRLVGTAELCVRIDLPPPFCFTPRSLLDTTGHALLKSVLLTIQQRLKRQLIADYQAWARGTTEPQLAQVLSP